MKRITFELYRFTVPLAVPFTTSKGTYLETSGIIVRAVAEDGQAGLGEISTFASSPQAKLPSAMKAAQELERFSEETDCSSTRDNLQRLVDRLYETIGDPGVLFGFETAVAELFSKQAELPLAKWLHSTSQTKVAVNGLLFGSADEIERQIASKRTRGFSCYKLKVGLGSAENDIELISRVRSLMGERVALRVDANSHWKFPEVRDILRRLSEHNVEYFEDPTHWQILPWLKRENSQPLALDYLPFMEDLLEAFFELRSIDVLVLKPSQVGGILKTLSISRRAAQAGVKTVISSNLESGVGIASCLHLAAVVKSELAAGLDTLDLLEDTLIKGDLSIIDGSMTVPQRKGLGVELSSSAMKYLQRIDL